VCVFLYVYLTIFIILKVSEGLGEAMVGINCEEMVQRWEGKGK